MSRVMRLQPRTRWKCGPRFCFLLLSATVLSLPACQNVQNAPSAQNPPARTDGWSLAYQFNPGTQEGEVTVREGTEVEVRFKKPYMTPPRVVLVELRGANALEMQYAKEEFQISRVQTTYFRVRNNHAEHGESWATVKWRAEGEVAKNAADALAAGDKTPQELLIERIKLAGGKVGLDPTPPKDEDSPPGVLASNVRDPSKGPATTIDVTLTSTVDPRFARNDIVSIDMHRLHVTDADLVQYENLKGLRKLNLYGTKVTDSGLKTISVLPNLQVLYLSDTAVTDAGLQSLRTLTKLTDLGLNQTKVTDAGIPNLLVLTNLHSLSLSGTKVTDSGVDQLKSLRSLRHLYVGHTSVSAAEVQALKKAIPGLIVSK
jgi:hypothetical protein